MDPKEEEARARYRYLQLKQKAALAVAPDLKDAVAQPSGNTPPSDPNFEVAGRSQPAMGGVPVYAPGNTITEGISPTRALLTNDPTHGIAEDIIRGAPAAIGGLVGAGAGAGVASIPGAALGGAGGEGIRQGAVGLYSAATGKDAPTTGDVLKNMGVQGATQAGGQSVGLGIGAAAKAARPLVNKLGAQVMRVGSAVSEKAGDAAMKNPSMLIDAKSPEAVSDAYKAFERYAGLTGLNDQIELTGKAATEGELEKHLFEVAARAKNGVASTPQELYHASQAASNLNLMGKLGNSRYAGLKMAISKAKNTVDDALEKILPEYKSLRKDYAMSKAASEFDNWLPVNKNQSPNVLRSVLAGREALAGTVAMAGLGTGNPVALAALPLISPKFYGTALKGAALAGKVPAGVYQGAGRAALGAGGSAVQGLLRASQPQLSPNMQAVLDAANARR